MLSEQEFSALVSVLQRTPLTPAEGIAVQSIMVKLQPAKPATSDPAAQP